MDKKGFERKKMHSGARTTMGLNVPAARLGRKYHGAIFQSSRSLQKKKEKENPYAQRHRYATLSTTPSNGRGKRERRKKKY